MARNEGEGERRVKVNAHHRTVRPRKPKPAGHGAPTPGPHEFSAEDEKAMRQGMRAQRGAPPMEGEESQPEGLQGMGGDFDGDE